MTEDLSSLQFPAKRTEGTIAVVVACPFRVSCDSSVVDHES